MIVFLLVCVLLTQGIMAGVLFLVIREQQRNAESVQRIHSAVASFEQRRAISMMAYELELYFQRPMEQQDVPVDNLPEILDNAWSNYEQRKAA